MNQKLQGKVALVTGASRGIGAATARALASEGADVAISYISSSTKAAAVVEELQAPGVRSAALEADQGDPGQVENLIARVVDHFGRLDNLFNNTGVAAGGNASELDRMYAVKRTAVVTAIRTASKAMADGGRTITLGSVLGARASFPGLADYSATKAAVVGYSKGAARDLASRGVTVNVLQAGSVVTDMNSGEGAFAEAQKSLIALGRLAQPEEIAAGVLFLASSNGSHVTGSEPTIDGGFGA